jgi:hypothetical protein
MLRMHYSSVGYNAGLDYLWLMTGDGIPLTGGWTDE